jgi:putative hydrolase of the HAD superfamily
MTLLFIFDMDDVLYDYDWRTRMAGMSELTGRSFDELRALWWTVEHGERAAEAGVYSTAEEYLGAFESAVGARVDEHDWVRVRGAAMTAWEGSLAAVRRASALGQVTLLTNNGALISKHLPAIAPELVPIFGEHLHTSSDYGARKPDPAVFERVLERYGVVAEDAFFADDLVENVGSAASVGITAHLFTSPSGLLEAVEAFAASRRR